MAVDLSMTNIMVWQRPQQAERSRNRSRHDMNSGGLSFSFDFQTSGPAAAQDAIDIMNGPERQAIVEGLARDEEMVACQAYVAENNTTDGFTLFYHSASGRDSILLRQYFISQDTAAAAEIAVWVRDLPPARIANVLMVSVERAEAIQERAVNIIDNIEPAVAADEAWQEAARALEASETRGRRNRG